MALSPQWLDELRMRTTLSAVIGRTLRLTKAGREFKACCPFHNEKTPSFYVNDEKGFYHCFGCEAHGDAIRWLTDQRGMPFMDAVKELAAEAGMEVPAPDPRAAQRAEKRASLHDVTAAAQEWFESNLRGSEGMQARSYLGRRGFSDSIVREFGFGYAPEDRQALKRALARFEEPMLIEAGMRITVEDKEPYDRFRGRLMLPIHDTRGRVIAFGGRILDSEATPNAPKYLNSPDTPLFDKGRTLYNLHRAAPAARQSGRLIVVEGYMDAIALTNAGIREAVAPLGTALTENQIELLWRQVERPILCFDGDNAGQRAARRAIERALPILQPGHSLGIAHLPPGKDPDDLIRESGVESFIETITHANSLVEELWRIERHAEPLDTPEQKAGLKARLIEQIESIKDQTIRSLYRRDLFELFFAFAFPKREQWKKSRPGTGVSDSPDVSPGLLKYVSGGARTSLSHAVLAGFALRPKLIPMYIEELWKIRPQDRGLAQGLELLDAALVVMEDGHEPPKALEALAKWSSNNRLPFIRRDTEDGYAEESLAYAVQLLVKRPALEAELNEATERLAQTWSERDQDWQAQARVAKMRFDLELRDFWRKWENSE